jgi:hypothetical protein
MWFKIELDQYRNEMNCSMSSKTRVLLNNINNNGGRIFCLFMCILNAC